MDHDLAKVTSPQPGLGGVARRADPQLPAITVLNWDTEGGKQADIAISPPLPIFQRKDATARGRKEFS